MADFLNIDKKMKFYNRNTMNINVKKESKEKNVNDKPKEVPNSATIPKKKDASLSPLPKKEEKKIKIQDTML